LGFSLRKIAFASHCRAAARYRVYAAIEMTIDDRN
jgi:hypothetical protein